MTSTTNQQNLKHVEAMGLDAGLAEDTAALLAHPLYNELNTVEKLRVFMKSHVFAVWDFMSLLKSLQGRITCVHVPWVPRANSNSVRFINEIVLAEESDEVAPGVYLSHYELYLRAMDEVGADTSPIRTFVRKVTEGASFDEAMSEVRVPQTTKDFVKSSLEQARGPVHATAASFFYGREDIIPSMFQAMLGELERQQGVRCENFRLYLKRHIEIDSDSHGPLASKLVANLCEQNETKLEEAHHAARVAVRRRIRLWDGILEQLKSAPRA
jgi:Protein of unknown function (DUF3050)